MHAYMDVICIISVPLRNVFLFSVQGRMSKYLYKSLTVHDKYSLYIYVDVPFFC